MTPEQQQLINDLLFDEVARVRTERDESYAECTVLKKSLHEFVSGLREMVGRPLDPNVNENVNIAALLAEARGLMTDKWLPPEPEKYFGDPP